MTRMRHGKTEMSVQSRVRLLNGSRCLAEVSVFPSVPCLLWSVSAPEIPLLQRHTSCPQASATSVWEKHAENTEGRQLVSSVMLISKLGLSLSTRLNMQARRGWDFHVVLILFLFVCFPNEARLTSQSSCCQAVCTDNILVSRNWLREVKSPGWIEDGNQRNGLTLPTDSLSNGHSDSWILNSHNLFTQVVLRKNSLINLKKIWLPS